MRIAIAILLWFALPADAATAPALDISLTGPGAHERLVELVREAQEDEFASVMARLDGYLAAHPDDVVMAVERCRFIDYIGTSEELYVDAAGEQLETCHQQLGARPDAGAAPVRLYFLDQLWGDDAIAEANELLPEADSWSRLEQARLLERLANLYASKDAIRAGAHAARAIVLDPASSARTLAAEYYIRIGNRDLALRVLNETPEGGWPPGELDVAVRFLVGVGAVKEGHALLMAHPGQEISVASRLFLARALYDLGEADLARALVESTELPDPDAPYVHLPDFREMFELERDHGTRDAAVAAYRALRDTGLQGDPFARHRLALLWSHPGAPWRWADTLGIGVLLLALGAFATLPGLLVVPVHYRSLVKRLRGQDPAPPGADAPWSLRQMWYAIAAPMVIGLLAMYFLAYQTFQEWMAVPLGFPDQYTIVSSDVQLGNAMLAGTLLSLLALLPLLSRAGLGSLFRGRWAIWKSVLSGFGLALLLIIIARVIAALWNAGAPEAGALGSDTVRGLQGMQAAWGWLVMMLFIAVLVPVVEEIVFRGVVLRTLSRHIALWVAVILQAAAFMVLHEELESYAYIFVLALLAAWLARRSGGLLAPIMLHATNNAFAGLSVLALERVFRILS